MFDGGLWTDIAMPPVQRDPLKFKDDKRYTDRLKIAKAKTGRDDCMAAAYGEINGRKAVVLVQDFAFMGGSLGMAAGEAFIKAAETAVARKAALIVVTAPCSRIEFTLRSARMVRYVLGYAASSRSRRSQTQPEIRLPHAWIARAKRAIATVTLNFSTHRQVRDYVDLLYAD
jgi:hypothetical protein